VIARQDGVASMSGWPDCQRPGPRYHAAMFTPNFPRLMFIFALGLGLVSAACGAEAPTSQADGTSVPADLWSLEKLWTTESLIALLTLTALEIVLGIDNVIFIAILSGKLPQAQRSKAQKTGIGLAVVTRILLLLTITWLMALTRPLFPDAPWKLSEISGKGLILILGGLFLMGKAAWELHEKLEASEGGHAGGAGRKAAVAASFGMVILQIVAVDLVFSLDSVITAVGMAEQIYVMIAAVMIAAVVMIVFARTISQFVERHPTLKVLALAFLILIGFMLFAEGFGHHVPKGYIYFAMAFSLAVEMINMRVRKAADKVRLHHSRLPEDAT
jgi:predicted tellurium resistance membrane protein TerC